MFSAEKMFVVEKTRCVSFRDVGGEKDPPPSAKCGSERGGAPPLIKMAPGVSVGFENEGGATIKMGNKNVFATPAP